VAEKFFAFEVSKVSIAFGLRYGLGDSVVARKVFDALTEIEPDCAADIFLFGGTSPRLRRSFFLRQQKVKSNLEREKFYEQNVGRYDLSV